MFMSLASLCSSKKPGDWGEAQRLCVKGYHEVDCNSLSIVNYGHSWPLFPDCNLLAGFSLVPYACEHIRGTAHCPPGVGGNVRWQVAKQCRHPPSSLKSRCLDTLKLQMTPAPVSQGDLASGPRTHWAHRLIPWPRSSGYGCNSAPADRHGYPGQRLIRSSGLPQGEQQGCRPLLSMSSPFRRIRPIFLSELPRGSSPCPSLIGFLMPMVSWSPFLCW